MIDLGYIGNQYTWRHGASVERRKTTRLDRAICCDEWRQRFPLASMQNLGHAHSDHCPLLLEKNGVRMALLGEKPSKFQAT